MNRLWQIWVIGFSVIMICIPVAPMWQMFLPDGIFVLLVLWASGCQYTDQYAFPWCLGLFKDLFYHAPLGLHATIFCLFTVIYRPLSTVFVKHSYWAQWCLLSGIMLLLISPGVQVYNQYQVWGCGGLFIHALSNLLCSAIIWFCLYQDNSARIGRDRVGAIC